MISKDLQVRERPLFFFFDMPVNVFRHIGCPLIGFQCPGLIGSYYFPGSNAGIGFDDRLKANDRRARNAQCIDRQHRLKNMPIVTLDFCTAILTGSKPRSSADLGIDVVRMVEAVDASLAQDGRRIELDRILLTA